MRPLMLCLLTAVLAFSSAARADDDKTFCQKAYRASDSAPDKLAACIRFLATNTGTPRERALAHDVLAYAQSRQGQYAKALDEYTLETQADPATVNGYFMRARMFRLLSQYDKAIEAANQALKVTPGDWQSLVERGKAYAANGNLQAAAADFENATVSNPNLVKTADIQATLGLALNEKKDFAAAIGKFDAALATEPNRKDAILGRCTALKASNGPPDQIDACGAALLKIDTIACAVIFDKEAAERAAACGRILAMPGISGRPLSLAHLWKSNEAIKAKAIDDSFAEIELAIKADPDFWRPYDRRASLKLDKRGNIDGAITDFDEAIKRNPEDFQVYVHRGDARRSNGDYIGAIADYNVAIPHFVTAYLTKASRGVARVLNKDDDGAIEDLTDVLDHVSEPHERTTALTWRCRAYFDKGNLEAALPDCNEAIRLNRFWVAYTARGNIYQAKGDFKNAFADFDASIKLEPNYIKAYADRGFAYEQSKDFDNARADYQVAATKVAKVESAELRDMRQLARQRLATLPQPAPLPQKQGALPSSTRVALVIGNGAYKNVPALPNPPKDANAVAKALEGVGFSVVKLSDDMPRDGFLQALHSFSRDAAKADWAVVYYAGHGMEIGGVNYLIPVDAKLLEDTDAAREAVSLELVIASVSGAKKLRLVMLDACRDNPFAETMQRSIGVQLVNKGLSNIEPDAGIMIVYATKHGETAMDGAGGHSPFATAVISDIPKPGIEVRRLFDVVRDDVMKATDRAQQPFSYGSLPGSQEFYFVAGK